MPPSSNRPPPIQATATDPARGPTEQDLERLGLRPYNLDPPDWRLPIQTNQPALGFPGLHPTHAGQQEDAVTRSLVQGGFSARTLVGVEYRSCLFREGTGEDTDRSLRPWNS